MKYLLTILLLVVLVVSVASSQRIANNRSYAANDTTATFNVDVGDKAICFWFKDSVNVAVYLDYKYVNSDVWATYNVVADSTNSATTTGVFLGYTLRRGTTNNIPGATQVRARLLRRVQGNGVTTPNYSAWITND